MKGKERESVDLTVLQNRHGKAFARLISWDDGGYSIGYQVGMDFKTVDISESVCKELAELAGIGNGD